MFFVFLDFAEPDSVWPIAGRKRFMDKVIRQFQKLTIFEPEITVLPVRFF